MRPHYLARTALVGLLTVFLGTASVEAGPRNHSALEFSKNHSTIAKVQTKTAKPSTDLINLGKRYMGRNPTKHRRLWCADFMNLILKKSGRPTTGSRMARSFTKYGKRVKKPSVGVIAVLSRGRSRKAGHVGVVTGLDKKGNLILLSGNHGGKVGIGKYPRNRVIAYVVPPPPSHS